MKTPYYQKTNRDGSGQFFAKLIIMPLPSKHPELLSSTLKPHFCVSFDINYKLRIQIYLQKNLRIRWLLKITRDFQKWNNWGEIVKYLTSFGRWQVPSIKCVRTKLMRTGDKLQEVIWMIFTKNLRFFSPSKIEFWQAFSNFNSTLFVKIVPQCLLSSCLSK